MERIGAQNPCVLHRSAVAREKRLAVPFRPTPPLFLSLVPRPLSRAASGSSRVPAAMIPLSTVPRHRPSRPSARQVVPPLPRARDDVEDDDASRTPSTTPRTFRILVSGTRGAIAEVDAAPSMTLLDFRREVGCPGVGRPSSRAPDPLANHSSAPRAPSATSSPSVLRPLLAAARLADGHGPVPPEELRLPRLGQGAIAARSVSAVSRRRLSTHHTPARPCSPRPRRNPWLLPMKQG